jgi:mono/diheme cytochrome c family protein
MPAFAATTNIDNLFGPINQLVVLEDTNNDGVFDKRTVFADKLIMPRAFKILDRGCVLIGEPPRLIKACDTNGDLKADTRDLISDTFATQGVVEHGANGLFWGMDNSITVSEHNWNVAFKAGTFSTVPGLVRGQWGVTQDDGGRIYRNVNTDPLFVDYVPARYYARNPNLVRTSGLYESLVDQEKTQIWPARPTLGVNRGYRQEVTRPDGSASYYQGVSSPMIYRGTRLPKEVQGQPVVVDSPTNIVHLLSMKDDGTGRLSAEDFYKKGELIASTDERFRPVALAPGWDGAFYVIDMYRGVSQDGPLQTDYLREYVLRNKLQQGIHFGRIYRVVRDGMGYDERPHMLDETPEQWVQHLSHPNGWWRDTAQQLLVQRGDKSVVPALRKLARSAPDPRTRLQALWTLDGLDSGDAKIIRKALADASPDIRVAAIRLSEPYLADPRSPLRAAMLTKMDDPNWLVRRQLTATLGELPADARLAPILAMLDRYGSDRIVVDAAASGLNGQEGPVLDHLLRQASPNIDAITVLAGAVGKRRDIAVTQQLLALGTDQRQPDPVRAAILKGVALGLSGASGQQIAIVSGGRAGGAVGSGPPRSAAARVDLPAEPTALATLAKDQGESADAARRIVALVNWPGKPAVQANVRTPQQEAMFQAGKETYAGICAGCHSAEGQGIANAGAPLAGSRYVTARSPSALVRILMAGKEGKIGLMPPAGATMSEEELASVLTYIRGSWGNNAAPVAPAEIREWRQMYAARKTPWTDAELQGTAR